MTYWMALFQVGPVQEFIQTARKTQDYWAGSCLLSLLNEKAIEAVGPANVVFPAMPSGSSPGSNAGTMIPNRFLAIIQDKAAVKSIMEDVVEKAKCSGWEPVAQDVAIAFKSSTGCDLQKGPFAIEWKNQVNHAFEFLWVALPWDGQDASYSATYKALEQLLGARKATRWFDTPLPSGGPQCSLCGRRLAILNADPASVPPRNRVTDDWKRFRAKQLKTRFREGERLCAVCLIKRLAPHYASEFLERPQVPSTSSIATAGFLKATLPLAPSHGKAWNQFISDLRNSPIPEVAGESITGNAVPTQSTHPLGKIEGDWLIEDTYERLACDHALKTANLGTELDNLKSSLFDNVIKPAKGMVSSGRLRPDQMPAKYYAALAFDGDSIGKYLSAIGTRQNHRSFSQLMADFAHLHVPKIIQQNHAGFLAYAGGDEGLAFLTLSDLLSAMSSLHDAWEGEVREIIRTRALSSTDPPTLSLGAVISHHQQGLGRVIEAAFAALEQAKSLNGKDAFAITVLRRSGAPMIARARWTSGSGQCPVDSMQLLADLVDAYQKGDLSAKWYRDMESMGSMLKDPPMRITPAARQNLLEVQLQDLFSHECQRLMARHDITDGKLMTARFAGDIANLRLGLLIDGEENPFRATMNLMDLAQFISGGGVR